MDLQPIDGGMPGALTPPDAPVPGAPSSYPRPVAQVLSFLANLIDDSIALRGEGIGVREFAAGFFGVPCNQTVATTRVLRPMEFQLAGLAFAADLDRWPASAVIGQDQEEPPRWERLRLGDLDLRIPMSLAAAFNAGELAPAPLVVQANDDPYRGEFEFTVYTRLTDAAHGETYLDGLIARSRDATNPFRNQVLAAKMDARAGLVFAEAPFAAISRADVVLPEAVWDQIDGNVGALFANLDRLSAAGLACNRGLLLTGPPGTGKTAVCRALAAELAGTVTVVFCDGAVIGSSLQLLYRELADIVPALVIIEDIDLLVGDRNRGGGGALIDFLLALDGAMSSHRGVVTVATTNDPRAIDAAARRSCRFDAVLEVPVPDLAARVGILEGYLRALDAEVDVRRVALATAGYTGADLRELVGNAVLKSAGPTTELLLELARTSHRRPLAPGQYL